MQRKKSEIEISEIVSGYLSEVKAQESTAMTQSLGLTTEVDSILSDFKIISPETSTADLTAGRTLTIFLCGTCANRDDYKNPRYFDGENISHTYTITEGVEFVDKIIVDGPGSGEKDAESLWVDYKPYSDAEGIALGKGIEERLDHIMAVIKNTPTRKNISPVITAAQQALKNANEATPITKINIVGWSRGAAAGITLANRLSSEGFHHIPVNLVLLDPVPGVALSNKFNRKLSTNVQNCFVLYAEDERSAFFNPVIPDPEGCHFYPILLPGGHAQVAGDDSDHDGKKVDGAELQSVGKIARYVIQHLLQYLGTKLDPSKVSTHKLKDLLPHYQTIKNNRHHYRTVAQRVPYTFNQIQGEERKVILGNDYYGNQYFSIARTKLFPPHESEYQDGFHQHLTHIIKEAETTAESIHRSMSALFNTSNKLSINDFADVIELLSHERLNDKLVCRALNEELQTRYKKDDLTNITNRHFAIAHLKEYFLTLLQQMIDAHNKKCDLELACKTLDIDANEYLSKVKHKCANYEKPKTRLLSRFTKKAAILEDISSQETLQDKKLNAIVTEISQHKKAVEKYNQKVSDLQKIILHKNNFSAIAADDDLTVEKESCAAYINELHLLQSEHENLAAQEAYFRKRLDDVDETDIKEKIAELKQMEHVINEAEEEISYTTANPHKLMTRIAGIEAKIEELSHLPTQFTDQTEFLSSIKNSLTNLKAELISCSSMSNAAMATSQREIIAKFFKLKSSLNSSLLNFQMKLLNPLAAQNELLKPISVNVDCELKLRAHSKNLSIEEKLRQNKLELSMLLRQELARISGESFFSLNSGEKTRDKINALNGSLLLIIRIKSLEEFNEFASNLVNNRYLTANRSYVSNVLSYFTMFNKSALKDKIVEFNKSKKISY